MLVEVSPTTFKHIYNAESPDESALVDAAANFGYRFVERVSVMFYLFVRVVVDAYS